MASILLATSSLFSVAGTGIGAVIVSAWGGGGGAGMSNSSQTDGGIHHAGPGGNGAFLEFKIEGLKGTETIYADVGQGGYAYVPDQNDGDGGGGGAASVVWITDGTNTDFLCVVGGGGGGGAAGRQAANVDQHDAPAGGAGGAEGGTADSSEDTARATAGGGASQTAAGAIGSEAPTMPTKGTYAQSGGDGGAASSGYIGNFAPGGATATGKGGDGGYGGGEVHDEGSGGGGGGGWYGGGGGGSANASSTNATGTGGGGGSTKLNTSPSGFSYLTITKISSAAGTASPSVPHDGTASTQLAGATNEFSVSVGGQGGDADTKGRMGEPGKDGRVVIGIQDQSSTIDVTHYTSMYSGILADTNSPTALTYVGTEYTQVFDDEITANIPSGAQAGDLIIAAISSSEPGGTLNMPETVDEYWARLRFEDQSASNVAWIHDT